MKNRSDFLKEIQVVTKKGENIKGISLTFSTLTEDEFVIKPHGEVFRRKIKKSEIDYYIIDGKITTFRKTK